MLYGDVPLANRLHIGAIMADLIVDLAHLREIASHTRRAGGHFDADPVLARLGFDAFGSEPVATAARTSASVHDRMIRALDDDARVLTDHARRAAGAMDDTDAALARALR
jgi:hypothetical protein